MKTSKILVALFVATTTTVGAFAQTVDEIVDKHIAALGGDKIKEVKTLSIERSLSIQGMEIPTKSTTVIGKAMRTESSVMGNSMIQVVAGDNTGWMVRPTMMGGTGEPEDMPAEAVKQSKGQLDPFGSLNNYKEKGTKVELVGKEKGDNKNEVYHLKVTNTDGQVSDLFLDTNSYLVDKVVSTANGTNVEILFSDYKDYGGIRVANTMEMTNPQMGAMVFTTTKVTVNGSVDDSIFKKPAK